MSSARRGIGFRIARSAALLLVAASLATCSDSPASAGGYTANLSVHPIFPTGFSFAGSSLAIDTLHLIVVRPPSSVLADTSVSFPATSNALQIRKAIVLDRESEDLRVTLEFRGGGQVLFTGTQVITLTAGSGATTPPPIPVIYIGPGSTLTALTITPRDSVVSVGDTLPFQVTGIDGQQQPVPAFYVSWTTSGVGSVITADGVLKPGSTPGTFYVRARAPNGVIDSTTMTVTSSLFDAAADFSKTANPNGVWSSGWTPTIGGVFTLYSSAQVLATFDAWTDPVILNTATPTFSKNNTTSTAHGLPPGQVALHPACHANEFSVLRWTAPSNGTYLINVQFAAGDQGNTDAYVLRNSNTQAPLFSAASTATNPSFSQSIALNADETIDIVVGTGGDGCTSDTTPIAVTISH